MNEGMDMDKVFLKAILLGGGGEWYSVPTDGGWYLRNKEGYQLLVLEKNGAARERLDLAARYARLVVFGKEW